MIDRGRIRNTLHVSDQLVNGVILGALLGVALLGRSYLSTSKSSLSETGNPPAARVNKLPIKQGEVFVDIGATRSGLKDRCGGNIKSNSDDRALWPGDILVVEGTSVGAFGCETVQQRFKECVVMKKREAKRMDQEGEASFATEELADALDALGLGISDITSENAQEITDQNHLSHGSDTVFVCDPQ